ncbi:uncharacterized protein LOC131161771 isoform X2 [Malania oleifera]|nr:uncharacterized protein LOC131161771 isoform X2 [Malania oleifera]
MHRHSPLAIGRVLFEQRPSTLERIKELLRSDGIRRSMISNRLTSGWRRNAWGTGASAQLPLRSGADYRTGQYFVTMKVGTPAQKFLLVADTGSDLTWINCDYRCGLDCARKRRSRRRRRFFRADISTSFRTLPCMSKMCKVELANLFSLARCPTPLIPCAFDYRWRYRTLPLPMPQMGGAGFLVLGSVDSYGHLIVSKLDASGKDVGKLTFSALPRDCGIGEGGWAGLCFSRSQWSMAVVARSFCKSLDVYDQDIHLRTLRTLWYPCSLSFICGRNESSVLAVTEGCQLSIWDLRMKENGGCVHRIYGSPGDIFYAVCCSSTGNIAVGGADRTVTIYDPRRWSALSRWVHCSKYEITGLAFSTTDPDYIYIQGVDYEVYCGQWKERKKIFSFRGDSNWLGFNKCPRDDVLGGWCDSGSIFVVDVAAKENKLNLLGG